MDEIPIRAASMRRALLIGALACAAAMLAALGAHSGFGGGRAAAASIAPAAPAPSKAPGAPSVELSDSQMGSITVAQVQERLFSVETSAVGSIDFNEDMTVQVFTPYQGRIIDLFAAQGDAVHKGQPLFTLESPDFIQAESNLIAAAGVLDLTNSAWVRAKQLYAVQGIDQNDYEQASSNQQSAEGALRAARDAVAVFGKTEADIDRIVATRRVENALVVRSPITGLVSARNAAPGLLLQPGNTPAPYTVADLSTVWMLANIPESDSPRLRVGQAVTVSVAAYPGREFEGTVSVVGASVDPNTRRITVRSSIKDPQHELRPGMFANFTLRTAAPISSPAAPMDGVVREGDGTMSVWVTTDRRHFQQRIVRIGLQQERYDQILEGVRAGELIAVDGAIFLSNIAFGGAS